MKKVKYKKLIFIIIVLLCSLCHFNYEHEEDHLIIDINDKESLEDNDISYKESFIEFDKIFQKAKNLKENIEEEIVKINKSHDIMIEKINNIFEERHRQLKEEENNLKLELNLKVTQIKDDLEKNLIESNDLLLFFERTDKALKKYEKKNNNNEVKALCYISEIQKVNNKAKILLKKQINNIDIDYDYNPLYAKGLIFKDYCFSGVPAPIDIQVMKKDGGVYIEWDIGDIRIKNYDKKNIKYYISIEGGEDNMNFVASEKNLLLDKDECSNDIDYEIKICTYMDDDSFSDWSEKIKFKLNELFEIKNGLFGNIFNENKKF